MKVLVVGASKGLVISIFVLEGTLIGLVGAIVGAVIAWLALLPLPPVTEVRSGGLPIDRAQGDFLLAITLTTLAAMLASILPARNAARTSRDATRSAPPTRSGSGPYPPDQRPDTGVLSSSSQIAAASLSAP